MINEYVKSTRYILDDLSEIEYNSNGEIVFGDFNISFNEDTSKWEVFSVFETPGGIPNWDDPPEEEVVLLGEFSNIGEAIIAATVESLKVKFNQINEIESEKDSLKKFELSDLQKLEMIETWNGLRHDASQVTDLVNGYVSHFMVIEFVLDAINNNRFEFECDWSEFLILDAAEKVRLAQTVFTKAFYNPLHYLTS